MPFASIKCKRCKVKVDHSCAFCTVCAAGILGPSFKLRSSIIQNVLRRNPTLLISSGGLSGSNPLLRVHAARLARRAAGG